MSAAASSYEATHTPDMLAGEVNWRFSIIARLLPTESKLAPKGVPQLLAAERGVGKLTSRYLGAFAIAVEADFDAYPAVLVRDFTLVYGSEGGTPVAQDDSYAAAEDFANCPPAMLNDIAYRLERLHASFVAHCHNEPPPVIRLADHQAG